MSAPVGGAPAPSPGMPKGANGSLVILGAADGSVTTYQRARELGYRTIAVDNRPEAPAVAFADEYVQVSVRAPERIAAALLEHEERDQLAGVLCPASDVGLPAQAWLARHWRLPHQLPEAALRASVDKAYFRQLCERLGLPGYRSVAGRPGTRLRAAAGRLRFPVLVKPVDASGSRGVVLCTGPDELRTAFGTAAGFSASGRIVVEEFVAGEHLTVEVLVAGGRVAFHAVTERTLTPPPLFVTVSHLLPARLTPETDAALVAMVEAVCADLGYRDGSLTLDAVLGDGGELMLIEMGARMGGNGLAELIETCYGVDIIGASIAFAVGEPVVVTPTVPRPTMTHILTADSEGLLAGVDGVAEVMAIPEVVDLQLFVEVGAPVRTYQQAGYKLGQVVLSGTSPAGLYAVRAEVDRLLRFLVAERDMAVPLP